MIYTILIIVYLLSAALMWKYFHLAYSKGGIKSKKNPHPFDAFFTFMPYFNTANCLVCWVFFYPTKTKILNLSKFFNIKY